MIARGPSVSSSDDKTKRVLLIAPMPFYATRGSPMNVLQMCRVLTGAGYRVDLATYPIGETVSMPGLSIHRSLGFPGIHSVPIGFSWRKVLLDLLLSLTVVRLLLRRRYLHAHAVEESVFLIVPWTLFGVRLVYDLDSLLSDQLYYSRVIRSRLLRRMSRVSERFALRRSVAAVTVCQALTDAVAVLSPETRVFQVEDAPLAEACRDAVPERVAALRNDLGVAGRPVVLYTGNLERYQGISLLVDSVPFVLDEVANAVFVIVGGAEAHVAELREELVKRGLEAAVHVVGARPSEEMPEWMALADILVSPRSLGENTPLKIYTYMLAGRPIVATDLITHTQVLDETNAVLCQADAEALAAGIVRVLRDPAAAEAIAAQAQQLARNEYSSEAFSRKLLAAYEEIAVL